LPRFANADCPHDFVPFAAWNAQRTSDAGLFRAGFGHAAGVRLQIADRDQPATRDGLSGDAFADGNGFDNTEHLWRQADLCREVQLLLFGIKRTNRAGFRMKFAEDNPECFLQNIFARLAVLQQ
jgi:hypothetical protein